jgi:cyclophilin family peptidyl-prolyl cis-trans isomerase
MRFWTTSVFFLFFVCSTLNAAELKDRTLLVTLETTRGPVLIELQPEKAPVTVKNFLEYVNRGFYDGTIFHRVIPGFMIQGGGFTTDMEKKNPNAPIPNEADNGLKNNRGTIAMARTSDPHSATCQFFINTKGNHFLDFKEKTTKEWGYAVFGKVVEGMDVVDIISRVKTRNHGPYQNVPVTPVVIEKASVNNHP